MLLQIQNSTVSPIAGVKFLSKNDLVIWIKSIFVASEQFDVGEALLLIHHQTIHQSHVFSFGLIH